MRQHTNGHSREILRFDFPAEYRRVEFHGSVQLGNRNITPNNLIAHELFL
jgi:hypothetical protein